MNRSKRSRSKVPSQSPTAGGLLEQVTLGTSAALVTLSMFVPSEGAAGGSGALLSVGWMMLLVLVHVRACQHGMPFRVRAADGLVLLLLLCGALSSLAMAWQGNPRSTLNVSWQWTALLAGYWICRHLFSSMYRMRWLVALLISITAGLAAHGLFQFFVTMPHNRAMYEQASEEEKQQILLSSGVEPEPHSPMRIHFENRLRSTEPFATFGLANSLAGVLATWLLVLIAWQLAVGREGRKGIGIGLAFVTIGILACLVLTKSRSAWIGFGVGAIAIGVMRWRVLMRRRWLVALGAGVLLAVIGAGVFTGALDRQVLTEARLSLAYRLQYWQAALQIVRDHPWFGCGPGNFQDYYSQYKLPMASETVADPHNLVLETAATLGVPAAILLLTVLLLAVARVFRKSISAPNPAEPVPSEAGDEAGAIYVGAGIGGLLAIVYGWLMNLPFETDPWFGLPVLLLIPLPVAGLVLSLMHVSSRRIPAAQASHSRPMVVALIVLTINLLAAGGISYLSVGLSWWLIVALIWNHEESPQRTSPKWIAAVGLAVSAALLMAGMLTGYSPVLNAQAQLDQLAAAMQEGDIKAAREAGLRAAEADRWSPEPWQQLAQIDLERSLAKKLGAIEDFDYDVAQARLRNCRSQTFEFATGVQYLRLYQRGGYQRALAKSLATFVRAAELYPNSNFIHGQLAWVAHLAGDSNLAGQHAARALELDAANPHWEQQLGQRVIHDFGASPKEDEPSPAQADAELIVRWLRSRYYGGDGD